MCKNNKIYDSIKLIIYIIQYNIQNQMKLLNMKDIFIIIIIIIIIIIMSIYKSCV